MKFHFILLGENKRDAKQFRFHHAKNIKTFQLYFYFFGIVIAYGHIDILGIYDKKVNEEMAVQQLYETTNRSQRRQFLHNIKKMKNNIKRNV